MYIKLKPTKDTTITELKPTNNYGRDSELFVGSSLLYNEDDQLVSYFKKKSRILISFDIEQYKNTLKQLNGNYTAKLVLFDKTNYIEQKNKEPYSLNIYPLSLDWDEGIYYASEGKNQQSSWNEKDYQFNNWSGTANVLNTSLTATLIEQGNDISIELDLLTGMSYNFSFSRLANLSTSTTSVVEWSLIKIDDGNSLRDDGSFAILTGSTSGNIVMSTSAWVNESISFVAPLRNDNSWGLDKYRIKFLAVDEDIFVKDIFVYQSGYIGSTVSNNGGSWYSSISASIVTYGTEHSIFDVKNIVDCWVNDEIPNYGFLIKLNDLYEESVRHNSLTGQEFFKYYYSRHTHNIFRPYLEIYYDDAICNDRNVFYRGLNQNLYKSMIIYDDIVDLNETGNFPGTVDIYERVTTTAGTSAVLYKSGLQATRRSQGYYYTTFSYTGSSSSIVDVWNFDINQVSNTASLSAYMDYINMTFANGLSGASTIVSQFDDSPIKRIEIRNINDYYLNEDLIRLEFYFYKNNSIIPTYTYMSNSIPNSAKATVKEAYVSFVELSTGLVVVPPIKLNYNDSISWIELSSSIFYKNKTYYPILYYNDIKKTFNDYTFTVR